MSDLELNNMAEQPSGKVSNKPKPIASAELRCDYRYINRRAHNTQCIRRGTMREVKGDLTVVWQRLCDGHVRAYETRGYQVRTLTDIELVAGRPR